MAVTIDENDFQVFQTSKEMCAFAAKDFFEKAVDAVKEKGEFTVVLSGGNTPKAFFDAIVTNETYKKNIPWGKIKFFFGDERYVPVDDDRNNYHSAYAHLFSKVPVNPKNIFRIPTDGTEPHVSAEKYEHILRKAMNIKSHECPKFDVCYLGLGDNAHTASLWPHSEIVRRYANNHMKDESPQLVVDLFVKDVDMYRITLTPNAINCAKQIIFLVAGADKASAVYDVVEGTLDPIRYPAQLIERVHTPTYWYLDVPAAEKLLQKNVLKKVIRINEVKHDGESRSV